MIVAVFVRRLKEGVTFEDFERAWEADDGYGVPARVFNAVDLADPRRVLSVGFVGASAQALASAPTATAEHDRGRHDRIEPLLESTELRAMYDLRSEHDFSTEPRSIAPGSAESLLAALASGSV